MSLFRRHCWFRAYWTHKLIKILLLQYTSYDNIKVLDRIHHYNGGVTVSNDFDVMHLVAYYDSLVRTPLQAVCM